MESEHEGPVTSLFWSSVGWARRFLFRVLSMGPIPNHLAFILDGNRRYAKKWDLGEGMGHRAGFLALMSLMKYCYELGVRYVTIYAFSIDNFRRKPEEVKYVMDLMLEKIEGLMKEESMVKKYGVRVHFIGNLSLLNETVGLAAEKAMKATCNNNTTILLICVAYTSTDEIVHAAQVSCESKWYEMQPSSKARKVRIRGVEEEKGVKNGSMIKLSDIEKNMYMGLAPDPDVLVRTSGETRLSNFLLWQTWNSVLYSPDALWPEIGLPHLVWAVLSFQRAYSGMEKRRKQL